MALEASGLLADAKEFYQQKLRDDDTDVVSFFFLPTLDETIPCELTS